MKISETRGKQMVRFFMTVSGVVLLLGLTSCGSDTLFAGSKPLDPAVGWASDDVAKFDWQVSDTLKRHDFFIDLRHNQEYPFTNLYLFVDYTFPNGLTRKDTISCELADERGRWFGSGFGNLIEHRIGFRQQTGFPLRGDYTIKIAHGMRVDPLPGMLDVGFRLEPALSQEEEG
jgi:gliding motility-associated lipoprotein GldH